ncbi:hypothetical protein OC835_007451 [Tilletia horrida]|nr:hypothetical protein OC835_007451 [Tilletia horrida]
MADLADAPMPISPAILDAISQAAVRAATAAIRERAADDGSGARDGVRPAQSDRSKTTSFLHDPAKESARLVPWPNSTLDVPKDVIALARTGIRLPLIWLTVEGMREAAAGRRKLVTMPLDRRGQEQLAEALRKDLYLPRGAFSLAMQVLAVVWKAVGPQPQGDEPSQSTLIEELHLCILQRATDEHWPIWRAYAKRVLDVMWEEREPDERIGFDITRVNDKILRQAEQDCGAPPNRVDDLNNISKTLLTRFLLAEGDEATRLGKEMDDWHQQGIFGLESAGSAVGPAHFSACGPPPARIFAAAPATSVVPLKRSHRELGQAPQPFLRAPPSYQPRDGGADVNRGQRGLARPAFPRFCSVCFKFTSDHDFRTCVKPGQPHLEYVADNWRVKGKSLPFCNRFNSAESCVLPRCSYGHYCTFCGADDCTAISHLVPQPRSGK